MSWLLVIVELVALLYLCTRIFDDAVVVGISIWKAAREESREERLGATQAGAVTRQSSRLERETSDSL